MREPLPRIAGYTACMAEQPIPRFFLALMIIATVLVALVFMPIAKELLLAAVFNDQITPFTNWLKSEIGKLRVEVRLNAKASPSLIDQIRPDAAIFATGGEFLPLRVPGADRRNVFSGQDLVDIVHGRPAGKGLLLQAVRPLARAFYSCLLYTSPF